MLRIDDPFQDTLYSLQDDPTTSKLDGEPVHSPPGKGSSVVFRIVKEHFLEKGDRGFCSPNADIKACMERCKARTYYEKCGCLPFYMTDIFGNSFHECPPSVLISCVSNIKQPSNACDCLVGCARTKIEIVSSTRTLLPRRLRNSSMISVKQNSRIFTEYLQLKRFKTVDLLSTEMLFEFLGKWRAAWVFSSG
ncbi:hypothetical protein L596_003392 [Steinernema carpocapsae]|uniref:Uncharacterized protein n=1 Tax=Steinernema carpocapsae TaxID=34508 RepID=A0A4U8USJ1_STECR|nr:hypothetical protein L596_003392 [Steinernema carpocapsae]